MFKKWLKEYQMGFPSVQAGIIRRFLREEGSWSSHLNNSRNYITNAVKTRKPKSIRILGSGWLLDIPIQELIVLCDSIVLEDIVHPAQIVNKYSTHAKIGFEYEDVTNGMVDLFYGQKRKNFDFNYLVEQLNKFESKVYSEDIIISSNLLSQPSVMLTDYLAKKVRISRSQVDVIAEIIQQKLYDALPQGKSIVISDYEEEYYDDENKLIGSKPTIFINLPFNSSRQDWEWIFDTKMFYKEDCKTILKVAAYQK